MKYVALVLAGVFGAMFAGRASAQVSPWLRPPPPVFKPLPSTVLEHPGAAEETVVACPIFERVYVTADLWNRSGFQDMWVFKERFQNKTLGLFVAPGGITTIQWGPGVGDITPYASAIQLLRTAYATHMKVSITIEPDAHITTIETTSEPCGA